MDNLTSSDSKSIMVPVEPPFADDVPTDTIKAKLMIIDGDPSTAKMVNGMLALQQCEIIVFPLCPSALKSVREFAPDLILLADRLIDGDGLELCRNLKIFSGCKHIPIIFITTAEDAQTKTSVFNAGADDIIAKPLHFAELRSRVVLHLKLISLAKNASLRETLEKQIEEISEAQLATIFALARLAEQRDEDTGAHLERVREYCRLLAEQLAGNPAYQSYITPEFIDCIQHAAPLHDVGKVAIPDSILLKPGKLTTEEFETMKTHSILGADNMQVVFNNYSANTFVGMGIEIALYHHERWDGSGYPDRLIGKNIPLSARIMALADFYDALRSDRCYRKGLSHQEVVGMIVCENGKHFDPGIVKAFLDIQESFEHVMDSY